MIDEVCKSSTNLEKLQSELDMTENVNGPLSDCLTSMDR